MVLLQTMSLNRANLHFTKKTVAEKPITSKKLLTECHVSSRNRTALERRGSSLSLSGTTNKISRAPP